MTHTRRRCKSPLVCCEVVTDLNRMRALQGHGHAVSCPEIATGEKHTCDSDFRGDGVRSYSVSQQRWSYRQPSAPPASGRKLPAVAPPAVTAATGGESSEIFLVQLEDGAQTFRNQAKSRRAEVHGALRLQAALQGHVGAHRRAGRRQARRNRQRCQRLSGPLLHARADSRSRSGTRNRDPDDGRRRRAGLWV